MTRICRAGAASFLISAIVVATLPGEASAAKKLPVKTFVCGAEVSKSVRLGADVGSPTNGCVADGLRATKRGITIDLGGHTIWGNGQDDVMGIEAGVSLTSGATVRNGTVRGFERGIHVLFNLDTRVEKIVAADNEMGVVVSGSRHVVNGVVSTHNDGIGIFMLSNDGIMKGNVVTQNGGRGIRVSGDRTEIRRNTSAGNSMTGLEIAGDKAIAAGNVVGANDQSGIVVAGGERILLKGNSVVGNAFNGIWFDGVMDGTIKRNRVIDNGREGIRINGSNNEVIGNIVSANVQDGIDAVGDANVFKGNVADANVGSGIEVDGADQKVVKNKVTGNGASGIRFDSGGGKVARNRMVANGFGAGSADGAGNGLDAALATLGVFGEKNVARANDGPPCSPDVCDERETDLPPASFLCGANVSSSVRLTANVGSAGLPCVGHGLVVTAPNVTIDLDGHTIFGNGTDNIGQSEAGVRIDGHKGVKVMDGRIRGFEMGVLAIGDDSAGAKVDGVVAFDSSGPGMQLDGKAARVIESAAVSNALTAPSNTNAAAILVFDPRSKIVGSLASGNGQSGIRGFPGKSLVKRNISTYNDDEGIITGGLNGGGKFASNVVVANGEDGLKVGTPDARIKKNIVARNGVTGTFAGIDSGGDRAKVLGNVTSQNGGLGNFIRGPRALVRGNHSVSDASGLNAGIAVGFPASGSEIVKNLVVDAAGNGILANSIGILVERNAVYGNGDDGIQVGFPDEKIKRNRVFGNGVHGIHVVSNGAGARLGRNRAVGNGFATVSGFGLGIEASDADDVTGNNLAYGNDDPAGCDPSHLC